jgi:hypothetical protein
MAKATAVSDTENKKWQAENDLGCMIEYAKICKDKARLNAAMAVRKERMAALEALGSGADMKKAVK